MLINYRITTVLSRAPALSSAHLRARAHVPKQAVVPTRAQKGSIVRRSEQAITEIPFDLVSFVVMGWEIDAGPLHFSSNGMAVKPQLKVGYADDKVNVRAGVEDVRNGLSAAVGGQVHRMYESEGSGLNQVFRQLKNKSDIKVLDDIISAVPKLLSKIMRISQVKIADDCPVCAKMMVKGCVGVSGGLCLGWANTEGFHMVGVQGSASVAAGIGGDMLVGTHAEKPLVKCILGLPNVCIELVFEHAVVSLMDVGADFRRPASLHLGYECAGKSISTEFRTRSPLDCGVLCHPLINCAARCQPQQMLTDLHPTGQ